MLWSLKRSSSIKADDFYCLFVAGVSSLFPSIWFVFFFYFTRLSNWKIIGDVEGGNRKGQQQFLWKRKWTQEKARKGTTWRHLQMVTEGKAKTVGRDAAELFLIKGNSSELERIAPEYMITFQNHPQHAFKIQQYFAKCKCFVFRKDPIS